MKKSNKYTLLELSGVSGIPQNTLRKRCIEFGFNPTLKGKQKIYLLNFLDAQKLIEKPAKYKDIFPEVVYVTRTWHILESRLNFM